MADIIEFIKPNKESQFSLSGDKVKEHVCRHSHVMLDELRRVVECKTCKQIIDPYDFVYQIAAKEVRLRNNAALYRDEISGLMKEIESLQKQKSNLSRQVKRLL